MFKNATVLGIGAKAPFPVELLQAARFVPVSDLQATSAGFSLVRGDELAVVVGGHILLNYTIEKKIMPSSAVKVVVEARAAEHEEREGFLPGKKAMKELKERVIDELLPRALSSRSVTAIWIDLAQHRLVIDSASGSAVVEIQRALIKTFGDIGLQDVKWPRAKVVTEWLVTDCPANFTLDDQVVLKYPGERGKVVKYDRADLAADDVQRHVQKLDAKVESIAMTYADRLSFVMTEDAQLRRIRPLEIMKLSAAEAKDVDKFESNFALMTLELGNLINALSAEA